MLTKLADHPDRSSITAEIHARPMELVTETCRVRRLIFAVPPEPEAMSLIAGRFADFCEEVGADRPSSGSRQHSFDTQNRHVTWEFHTEFVTVTWRSALNDIENLPQGLGVEILLGAMLLGAARVDVIAESTIPERLVPGFNLPSLCLSHVDGAKAQVATDFVPDSDGFTRFELAGVGLSTLRRSIVVRTLLEIETYRTVALLGLPTARRMSTALRGVELELGEVLKTLADATTPASGQAALTSLHGLSVRSAQLSDQLGYRFAAGNAYGEILSARLQSLREEASGIGYTLANYVGNRVTPGLATCAAMEKRLIVLSQKLESAIELLNVRISVDMQVQNAAVLDSIAQTSRSQFLLQRTVEGLSTIAISYYALGIVSYAAAGPMELMHLPKALVISLAAPVVLVAVWILSKAARGAHPAP